MSIKTLIEAAEFVDNVETTTADEGSIISNSQAMTSSQSNTKISKDVTIQHWRKRAVAQSVRELNKTSGALKGDISAQENPGSCTQEQSSSMNFKRPTSLSPGTKSDAMVSTTSTEEKKSANERVVNGTHGSGSLNASHTSFPLPLAQTTAVVAAPLLYAPVPIGNFAMQTVNSYRAGHGSMPSTSGEISGTPPKSLPGHRTSYELSPDASRKKTQLGAITREAHNKLEKSRRAHLKGCYHRLRNVVPNLRSKVSNLVVLREALKYVQELKEQSRVTEEERNALMKQKTMKELKLQTLKEQLHKYIKPSEVDEILKRVWRNGAIKPLESESDSCRSTALSTDCQTPQTSTTTSLSTPLDTTARISTHSSANILNTATDTSAGLAPLLISSGSVLSSSTVNLVWENSNDSRRVCTMLPAPKMLSSAQIHQKTDEQLFGKANVSSNVPLRSSPVSSLTHFKPISANSVTQSNVKSYTGWNLTSAEMPTFMEGRRSPLKIVVKPVDSAKQQARVAKSTYTHQKIDRTLGNGEMKMAQTSASFRSKPNELVYRPRSSVTPPPPSNITPYFPRFSVGSGGSPPLTSILPNMSDESKHTSGGETEETRCHVWTPRTGKGDGHRKLGSISNDMNDKKRKTGVTCGEVDAKNPKIQETDSGIKVANISDPAVTCSSTILKVTECAAIPCVSTKVFPGSSGMTTAISPAFIPVTTPSFSSPLSSQSRSVTQVCFSTMTNSKRASSCEVAKSEGEHLPMGHFALPAMPAFTVRSPSQNSQPNRPQFPLGMMTPIMSPSSGYVPATGNIQCPSNGSRPSSASSTDSQSGSIKIAAPQVQYVVPIGYPGMIAMPNGTQMAFPQPVGGYIPMMPSHGQGCGFVMPQGMMMFKTPDATSQTTSNVVDLGTAEVETPSNNSPDKCKSSEDGRSLGPNKVMQPVMMTVHPGFMGNNSKQRQSPVPQQVQLMSPGFQPASPVMMPVAADQSGSFMFGGTPMMASSQGAAVGYQMPMNIVGFPVQMGGAPSMQFAMPRGFGFGFTGGVQRGMMTVDNTARNRRGSRSGSDVEGANPT